MTQKQIKKQPTPREAPVEEQVTPPKADQTETDALLDEIDELLTEIEAEGFTAAHYIQKGGQ